MKKYIKDRQEREIEKWEMQSIAMIVFIVIMAFGYFMTALYAESELKDTRMAFGYTVLAVCHLAAIVFAHRYGRYMAFTPWRKWKEKRDMEDLVKTHEKEHH